jgi:anti-sigma regulatory factor (Ser/Thr protein kinase)
MLDCWASDPDLFTQVTVGDTSKFQVDPSSSGRRKVPVLGRLAVRHAAASASKVRRRVADDLAGLGLPHDLVEDAALLLSEMVSNAVRFAEPLPGDGLLVSWGVVKGRLLLRVTDGGGRDRPQVRDASPTDTRGRGLAIVDAVSAAWGVKRRGSSIRRSNTVWAALPIRPAQGGPGDASAAESGSPP